MRAPRWALVAAALAIATANAGQAAIYYVGLGDGCQPSVEAAVGLAAATLAADEIRIVSAFDWGLSESLHLTNFGPGGRGALKLSGGWSSCTDPVGSEAQTKITFTGPAPVIEIDTTGSNTSDVILEHLTVSGSRARGIVVEGDSIVDLLDVQVDFSDGGLSVTGGATVTIDDETVIIGNRPVTQGGGIYCSDTLSAVVLDGFVGVNSASVGGGVYIGNECLLLLQPNARIYDNEATIGGGVYVTGGGTVIELDPGAVIDHNHAFSSGGGLGANGIGTVVSLAGGNINQNTAGFAGAGLYVNGSARVTLHAGSGCGSVCPGFLAYNELTAGARDGAAAVVYNNGDLFLFQTLVVHNRVPEPEPSGSVLHAEGAGSSITTEAAEIVINRGVDAVFRGRNGASIQVAFTTAAFNVYKVGFADEHALGLSIEGTGTRGRINTSIFYPVGGYFGDSDTSFSQVDCLITETTSGLPLLGPTYVAVADPLYTNVVTGDLRPQVGSPAIDFCDDALRSPSHGDLDGQARGYDHPGNPNGAPGVIGGVFDAGAYEIHWLFADGFESGDTSRWSGTAP